MRGGCLRGQVRYIVTREPSMIAVCHCTHCQKQSGSAFSLLFAVPRSSIAVDGGMATFRDTGDTGKEVARSFCPACGSPIKTDVALKPDLTLVYAGTLDDSSWVKPTLQIYCDSAQPWLTLDGLQSFPKMPE